MAPPCHHGWEKVQDNDGRVKTGASDGWKEVMRAPTQVGEENSFPYRSLRKRESGATVPLQCFAPLVRKVASYLIQCSQDLLCSQTVSGRRVRQAGSNKEPLAQSPLKSLRRHPEAPFSLGHSCRRSLPCRVAEGGAAPQPMQLLSWSQLNLERLTLLTRSRMETSHSIWRNMTNGGQGPPLGRRHVCRRVSTLGFFFMILPA